MTAQDGETEFDAWNPGIQSTVPRELRDRATIFRPENVFTRYADAQELHELTGIDLSELVAFRPERLALHELLIRVTADFVVPDGSRIGDLGINFRQITRLLLIRHVEPNMPAVSAVYATARQEITQAIDAALDEAVPQLTAAVPEPPPPRDKPSGWFRRRALRRQAATAVARGNWGPAQIEALERLAGAATQALPELAARTAARVMAALFQVHGCAWGNRGLIVGLATTVAGNPYCSDAIGRTLEPVLRAAAAREGLSLLPPQSRPVVINTKGASASGKSTLRPLHKQLTRDIGVNWHDFALISPDIWRKQLLDYDSLGAAFKYAGAFTADEVQIVDRKLDKHMARKNQRGEMPHLLIDRFRFDSFAPDSEEAGSNLLTRFGQIVYLFFMITPPRSLVERAWNRGLEFGRYKAVDDTLGHCVEAYKGIPDVFFTWVRRRDKQLQFEFLDNTVSFGERPRTVAFGDNHIFNILNVHCLSNIERYGIIDVDATAPQGLFPTAALLAPERHTQFLKRCIAEFERVNFAEPASGRIYLTVEKGSVTWIDRIPLQAALADPDLRAGLAAVAPRALDVGTSQDEERRYLDPRKLLPTLGQWGTWR